VRQVVLDTETTGLDAADGHRIIEIGCVELVNRKLTGRHFHQYINPQREVDPGAMEVHGITNEFLADKPLFEHVAADFLEFIKGAELIIHNAPFDVGFINAEFRRLDEVEDVVQWATVDQHCTVLDTLQLARQKHPGQRNSLDALCQRYFVDNSSRELHGALLDAEILADVYLAMTGGQTALSLSADDLEQQGASSDIRRLDVNRPVLRIITATAEELLAHEERLAAINKASGQQCLWLKQTEAVGEVEKA
jgi:DNA polymerase-3 subunit epsilon